MFRVFVLLGLLLSAQSSWAAGFAMYEWSARSVGMGGATVAGNPDASTVASNPAAMTELNGTEVMTGMTAIAPTARVEIEGQPGCTGEDNVWISPHAYAVAQLGERYWIGLGVYNRFGLGTEFDENWAGRDNVYYAAIKSVSVTPVLGLKLTDTWSVGLGVEANYFHFTQKKKVLSTYDVEVEGDDVALGVNLSTYYKPLDWLSFGLMYRSSISQHPAGDADSNAPGALGRMLSGDADGKIELPDSWTFAVCVEPLDGLSIEAGAIYTGWSSYDELDIRFNGLSPTGPAKKDWQNTWRLNLGLEYALCPTLDLRLGYVYDESPMKTETADYMVPANDRQLLCAGFGWHEGAWAVDFGYTYLMIMERKGAEITNTDGSVETADFVDGNAHLMSMSVSYKF